MKKKYFCLMALMLAHKFCAAQSAAFITMGPIVQLSSGAVPIDLAIADFDHNGQLDIAIAQQGANSVAVYRQASTGGFTLPIATYAVGQGPSALVALDLNYTGAAADLVVACGGDGSFYALSNTNLADGSLTVGPVQYYYGPAYGPNPRLAAGYIDRDSKPDLLFGLSTPSAGMTSFNYQGLGNWAYHSRAKTSGIPSAVLLNDLDGDSFSDIAASLPNINEVTIYRHDGSADPFPYLFSAGSPVHVPTLGLGPVDLTTADINQDSRADLLTANAGDNTISLLLGTGGAKFGTAVLVQQTAAPRKVLAVDLNGDRRPELITINADNTLNIYPNTGLSGPDRYGAPLKIATGANPVALRTADFNGDRQLDIAVACAGDNTVRLYYNTTVLSSRQPSADGFAVFPNPATNSLHIQRPAGAVNNVQLTVTLFDTMGRQVLAQQIAGNATVDVSNVPRGLYIVKILTDGASLTQKVELR